MHSKPLGVQKKKNENTVHFRHWDLKDESLGSETVEILQHDSFFSRVSLLLFVEKKGAQVKFIDIWLIAKQDLE